MYNLEILQLAKNDIKKIISYIYFELDNKTAAKEMRESINCGFEKIVQFPYGCSILKTCKNTDYDYRALKIKNFLMYYIIHEETKTVVVARVLYKKANANFILDRDYSL